MLGKIEGSRRGQQRMRWLDGITDSMNMSLSELRELVMDREAWHTAVHGATKTENNTLISSPLAMGKLEFVPLFLLALSKVAQHKKAT